MSIKKYRFYLLMISFIIFIIGALSYLYFSEQNDSYRDGTLVQTTSFTEESFL